MSLLSLINNPNIKQNPLISLAPMAGVTDIAFRTVCENLGADYSVTEMLASSPKLINTEKNKLRLNFVSKTDVKIIQIIGNDAQQMAEATKKYCDLDIDLIDINIGCPAKKISSKGAGSALLKDIPLLTNIIKSVVKSSSVPVTLKTRLGWNYGEQTILEVLNIAEDLGLALITIHGRFGISKFTGEAEYDLIAKIKQISNIPIIANGDIDSPEKAKQVLKYTGCDGVMVGRASVGDPWIFPKIKKELGISNVDEFNYSETVLSHIKQIHSLYDEGKGARYARKHIQKYLFNLTNSNELFLELSDIDDNAQQYEKLSFLLGEVSK